MLHLFHRRLCGRPALQIPITVLQVLDRPQLMSQHMQACSASQRHHASVNLCHVLTKRWLSRNINSKTCTRHMYLSILKVARIHNPAVFNRFGQMCSQGDLVNSWGER